MKTSKISSKEMMRVRRGIRWLVKHGGEPPTQIEKLDFRNADACILRHAGVAEDVIAGLHPRQIEALGFDISTSGLNIFGPGVVCEVERRYQRLRDAWASAILAFYVH